MITIFIAKCEKDDYRVTLASSKESVLSKPIQFLSEATSFASYSDAIIAANDMKISEDMNIIYLGYIDISGYDNHTGGDIFH
jgi:hypothetical protein